MLSYSLRVELPDRPGALADLAGCIAMVGGDIVSVQVLDRTQDMAVDQLLLELPGPETADALRAILLEAGGPRLISFEVLDPFDESLAAS